MCVGTRVCIHCPEGDEHLFGHAWVLVEVLPASLFSPEHTVHVTALLALLQMILARCDIWTQQAPVENAGREAIIILSCPFPQVEV